MIESGGGGGASATRKRDGAGGGGGSGDSHGRGRHRDNGSRVHSAVDAVGGSDGGRKRRRRVVPKSRRHFAVEGAGTSLLETVRAMIALGARSATLGIGRATNDAR